MNRRQEGNAKVFVLVGVGCVGLLVVVAAAGFILWGTTASSPPVSSVTPVPLGVPAAPAAASTCGTARACCLALLEMPGRPPNHTQQACDAISVAESTPMADQVCGGMLQGYQMQAQSAAAQGGANVQVPTACAPSQAMSPTCARAFACCEAVMRANNAPAAQAAQSCAGVRMASVSHMAEQACSQSLEAFRSMGENVAECADGAAPAAGGSK